MLCECRWGGITVCGPALTPAWSSGPEREQSSADGPPAAESDPASQAALPSQPQPASPPASAVLPTTATPAPTPPPATAPSGAKIMLLGDSITESNQGLS